MFSFFPSRNWEDLVVPLLKKVSASNSGNTPLDLVLSSHSRGRSSKDLNHMARPRKAREPSPDLIEIQAQIEAIK